MRPPAQLEEKKMTYRVARSTNTYWAKHVNWDRHLIRKRLFSQTTSNRRCQRHLPSFPLLQLCSALLVLGEIRESSPDESIIMAILRESTKNLVIDKES
jgi:hypothetical protein